MNNRKNRDGSSKKYILVSVFSGAIILLTAIVLQAALTIDEDMTCNAGLTAPVYIRANSGDVAVLNLTVTNGTSGATTVDWVNITFTNITWFDPSNLSALTAGTDSGVVLYNDTGTTIGVFEGTEPKAEYTDIPTWTAVDSDNDGVADDWRVNFTNPGPALLARWDFIVVIRTSGTLQNGTQFNLSIQANQIVGTDEVNVVTTGPATDIWKDVTITADTINPTSIVDTISPYWFTTDPPATLTITGTGSDNAGGSGLATVELWYRFSLDNATWDPWVLFATDSDPWVAISWDFDFNNGSGYYEFYSRATDNASNYEAAPASADAIAGYDYTEPVSSVNTISPYWFTTDPPATLTITGTGNDPDDGDVNVEVPSGLATVELWYRFSLDNATWGAWVLFATDTDPWVAISWDFDFNNGSGYYEFYSRATDNASNYEAAPASADAIASYDYTEPSVTGLNVEYPVVRINAIGDQYARRCDILNLSCTVIDPDDGDANVEIPSGMNVVMINVASINSTLGWAQMTAGASGLYYIEVHVDLAVEGWFDLYIDGSDNALNENTTEYIRVRLDTQVANGTTQALTWDAHPWVKEFGEYALFGFNATADAANDPNFNLTWVNVTFTSVYGFTTTDLLPLTLNSLTSGVGIFADTAAPDDEWTLDDTPIMLTSCVWDVLTCRIELSTYVPTAVAGQYYWFVVIRTNDTITEGDQFSATILANDIVFLDATTQPPADVTTTTFTADVTIPTVPTINPEPEFTRGNINNITCTDVSDTGSPVAYYFEINTTDDFGAPLAISGWISEYWYTFTNLNNNITYYYRVRAKDLVGHVSAPSSSVYSIQDYYWVDYPYTTIAVGTPQYSTSPTYINNSTPFSFTSSDNVSGVWKVEWSVKDSSGAVVVGPNEIILSTVPGIYVATTADLTLAAYTLADGNYNITFRTYDWCYNNITSYTTVPSTPDDPHIELNETYWIYLDSTPPSVTAVYAEVTWVSPTGQNWTIGTSNNITWIATDFGGSGIQDFNISRDDESVFGAPIYSGWGWTYTWYNWTGLTSGVKYYYNITPRDNLGQIGTYSFFNLKVNSTQDNDAPVIASGYPTIGDPKYRAAATDPWMITDSTPITIKAVDKPDIALPPAEPPISHSGVNIVWYYVNDLGNYSESGIAYDTITFTLAGYPEDVAHTIYYGARDNVSINASLGSFVVWIDNSPPSKTWSVGTPSYRANAGDPWNITSSTSITITATDNPTQNAGVQTVQYRWRASGGTWSTWTFVSGSSTTFDFNTIAPGTADGFYEIEYNATDNLDNVGTASSFTIRLDNTAPTVNLAITGTPTYTNATGQVFVNSSTEFTLTASNPAGISISWYWIDNIYYEYSEGNLESITRTFTIPSTYSDGLHTIVYGARDSLGNNVTYDAYNLTVYLYNALPTIIVITTRVDYHAPDCQNWTRGTTNNVTWVASPTEGFEITGYECQKGWDDVFAISPESTGWITQTYYVWTGLGDGERYFYRVRAKDALGQIGPWSYVVNSTQDASLPVSTIDIESPPASYPNDLSGCNITSSTLIWINATDFPTNNSGVNYSEYKIDTDNWTTYPSGGFTIPDTYADGLHTIYYRSVDNVGNVETEQSIQIYLDNTPPTSSVDALAYWNTTNGTILVTVSSANVIDAFSGVNSITLYYRYRANRNTTWSSWVLFGTDTAAPWEWSFTFDCGDGEYELATSAVDNLGNEEALPIDGDTWVALDTMMPYPIELAILYYWWTGPMTLTWATGDNTSGLENVTLEYCYSSDGALFGSWLYSQSILFTGEFSANGTFTFVPVDEGYYKFRLYVRDIAKNVVYSPTVSVGYELTPPNTTEVHTGEEGMEGWYKSNVTVTITGTDPGDITSGVKEIHYIIWYHDGTLAVPEQIVSGATATFVLTEGRWYIEHWAVDIAGNVGEHLFTDFIFVDTTPPIPTSIVVRDYDTGNELYTNELVVKLLLEAYDKTSGVAYMNLSHDAYLWYGYAWAAEHEWTLLSGSDGARTVYFKVIDAAGWGSLFYISASTILDTTLPRATYTLTPVVGHEQWTNETVIVTIDAYDDQGPPDANSGVKYLVYRVGTYTLGAWSWGGWSTIEETSYNLTFTDEGTYKVEYYAIDTIGNEGLPAGNTTIFKIDKIAPEVEITLTPEVPNGESGWYVSPVTITITASDSASGINVIEYNLDNTGWQSYTEPIEVSDEGTHIIEARAVDNVGLVGTALTKTFKIDLIKPSTTASLEPAAPSASGWYLVDVTLSLSTASDTSGIAFTKYRYQHAGTWSAEKEYTEPVKFSEDGTYVVEYYSKDVAGNVEDKQSVEFRIDKIAPTISPIEPRDGELLTTSTVTITAILLDDTSGIDESTIRLTINGVVHTGFTYVSTTGELSYIVELQDGNYIVKVEASDYAGLAAVPVEWDFIIDTTEPDTTAPITTITLDPAVPDGKNDWYISTVNLTLTAEDPVLVHTKTSGVKAIMYSINDGPWYEYTVTLEFDEDGTYVVKYYSIDNVDNKEVDNSVTFKIDRTAPIVSIEGGDRTVKYTDRVVTFTAEASDATSGINITSYKWDWEGSIKTGVTVTYEFPEAGTYTVSLTVEDYAGNSATTSVTITVKPKPKPPFIPGFELLALLGALTIAIALLQRKRK